MKLTRSSWLLVLLAVLAGAGILRLRFDVEILNLLPADAPSVQGLRIYQQHFAHAGELVVTVESPDAARSQTAARTLAAALRAKTNLVQEVMWQAPWLEFRGDNAELFAYLWLNQTPLEFAKAAGRFAPAALTNQLAATLESLATSFSPADLARLGYDPMNLLDLPVSMGAALDPVEGGNLFASADGKFRILTVQARPDLWDYRACKQWLTDITALTEEWRRTYPGGQDIELGWTGRPAFVAEISGGMERDINRSVLGTSVIIAALFWGAHRRFRPLLWLLLMLLLILAVTLGLGGLFLAKLNVVSAGFAAILLGLSVDYGMIAYQEQRSMPHKSAAEVRGRIGAAVGWSAFTTGAAFLTLNLSGLPGLAQLGTLISLGIVTAAGVMLFLYLPLVAVHASRVPEPTPVQNPSSPRMRPEVRRALAWIFTATLLAASMAVLFFKRPLLDPSPDPLRPRHSPAYAALERIKTRLNRQTEPLWIVLSGRNLEEIRARLETTQRVLEQAQGTGQIRQFTLPTTLWPHPENQAANRPIAAEAALRRGSFEAAARELGFTESAVHLNSQMLEYWNVASRQTNVLWPRSGLSRWIFDQLVATNSNPWYVVGLIHPVVDTRPARERVRELQAIAAAWSRHLPAGTRVTSWELLGAEVLDIVLRDLLRVLLPAVLVLLMSLWLTFRNCTEVLLSAAALVLSGLCLVASFSALGRSWNLLNLMALPLFLGAGVDYSIHIQLALRRRGSDPAAFANVIRALVLCAATTVAGFASLMASGNAGLASLGEAVALAIGITFLISSLLLPAWSETLRKAEP